MKTGKDLHERTGVGDLVSVLKEDRRFREDLAGERSLPAAPPRFGDVNLQDDVRALLERRGIAGLYSHQAAAIDLVRQGRHVVLMTPTASGKSLAYTIPVIEAISRDSLTKALYLFPLKGLEQDQLRGFNEFSAGMGLGTAGAVYDGDTSTDLRRKIRERLPNVIFTNPDMLHLAMLPFHGKWRAFFRDLRYVVIDEIHAYRGIFGCHVAQVFRRLRRICDAYGAAPRFIASSATIANPAELAEGLTGLPFSLVDASGAPSGGKRFLFLNPADSPYTAATRLFVRCIRQGIRTIVFTKARKITELIYSWAVSEAPELRDKISPYRAGFLPGERREIEQMLFSGRLLGVVSTSALELGVDIGGLDCCILCGYPGSVSSTWQRAGRVGRQGQESLVILIATQDALDRHLVRHPDEFFGKSHEAAVIDPGNAGILGKHLVCAAAELFLRQDERVWDMRAAAPVLGELVRNRSLIPGRTSGVWFPGDRNPHRDVSIRAIGERFVLVDEEERVIGEMNGARVFREAFPGAVYLHRGRQYIVERLDLPRKRAWCKKASPDYYTQPLSAGSTEILEERDEREAGAVRFRWGMLGITQQVTGYDRKSVIDGKSIGTHTLDLPQYRFETEGLWAIVEPGMCCEIEKRGYDLAGTLHAVEHAVIASLPLFSLCDRGDIGGLSYTIHPGTGLPVIFVYDGYEGGVGLSRRAMDIASEWLEATLGIITECSCRKGCPSCIQDPQCGNRNDPLDKEGAKFLLRQWLAIGTPVPGLS